MTRNVPNIANDPVFSTQDVQSRFLDELPGWLSTIGSAGKDLWFHCY